ADVVDLTGCGIDFLHGQAESTHQVVDEQHVPYLLAITVDRDRLSGYGRDDEVRQPSLVFRAELSRAVDAAHPEDHRRKVVDAGVVVHVLVRRPLGTAVGRVEIKRSGLRDAEWEVA